MFKDLLASPGVREVFSAGEDVGVMALHGGLEEGTFEIAQSVAEITGASLYAIVQPDDLRWHVPSIHFDPTASVAFAEFMATTRFALSIHGFGRVSIASTAMLGGRNSEAAMLLETGLTRRGFTAISDRESIPKALRGLHQRNPVNLPEYGGVQVELTPDLRRSPRQDQVVEALAAELPAVAAAVIR